LSLLTGTVRISHHKRFLASIEVNPVRDSANSDIAGNWYIVRMKASKSSEGSQDDSLRLFQVHILIRWDKRRFDEKNFKASWIQQSIFRPIKTNT